MLSKSARGRDQLEQMRTSRVDHVLPYDSIKLIGRTRGVEAMKNDGATVGLH
jgi:hypothetical protein